MRLEVHIHVDPFVAAICRAGAGGPARASDAFGADGGHVAQRRGCRRSRGTSASVVLLLEALALWYGQDPCTLSSMPYALDARRHPERWARLLGDPHEPHVRVEEWRNFGVPARRSSSARQVAFQPRGAWCLSPPPGSDDHAGNPG